MVEFKNGCTEKETLVTYSMFCDNPHVTLIEMVQDEDTLEEMVQLGFMHYSDDMIVIFQTGVDVGEVMIMGTGLNDFGGYEHYGMITREKLHELLESLPHIDKYLFETGELNS